MGKSWPNFFIVGAAKAGTTSLYAYLMQHPQIFLSKIKEPHFFSQIKLPTAGLPFAKSVLREQDYLELFRGADKYRVKGEASTSYLWSDIAPYSIFRIIPNARIIILLRDPIERAYSHYLMDVRANIQSLPFSEALIEDYGSEAKGWGVSHLYVELGLYYPQIKRYFEYFKSQQILILLYENLKENPKRVLEKTALFLGVDPGLVEGIDVNKVHNPYLALSDTLIRVKENQAVQRLIRAFIPLNIRAQVRNRFFLTLGEKPDMDPESRKYLQEIYDPDINALESFLVQKLPSLRRTWDRAEF